MIAQFVVLFLHAGSSLFRRSHAFPTAALTWPRRRSTSARRFTHGVRAAHIPWPLDARTAPRMADDDARFAFPGRTSQESRLRRRRSATSTTAVWAAPATATSLATVAARSISWAGWWLPPLAALSLSTLMGARADRSKGPMAGSGILVTLVTASLFSALMQWGTTTTGGSSIQQRCLALLLDLGWELFLPASLVFLLLSLSQTDETRQSTDSAASNLSSGKTIAGDPFSPSVAIRRLALPFVVACLGSVVGCAVSFFVSRQWWNAASWGRAASGLLLPPEDAAVAASCLAASFVGGSVNFFATAAIVVGPHAPPRARALVSSMASVDLIVMAAYFASLGPMLQSATLTRWFGDDPEEHGESSPAPIAVGLHNLDDPRRPLIVDRNRMQRWQSNGVGIVLASALALHVVRLARFVERLLAPVIPGTACAFIAIAIPALQRLPLTKYAIWTNMQRVSQPLATYSFLWLFATIGMSVDITETLRDGPACLVFSIAALLVHMGVTLVGCWLLGWQQRYRRDGTSDAGGAISAIRLEEALIASNAAIGGPATAAAFCGQLPDSNRRKAGLTVGATAYGVVGYGIGTTIGVTMFRWFTSILR